MEKRYSQTEKESLAIVWGCEHFHLYLYGSQKPFILVTDHKPLKLILQNPSSKPPARIERWNLRLQQYNFSIVYRPGKDNPTDYLSRHPVTTNTTYTSGIEAEHHVNLIAAAAIPLALTCDDVINATKDDIVLQKLIKIIHNNNWKYAMKNPDDEREEREVFIFWAQKKKNKQNNQTKNRQKQSTKLCYYFDFEPRSIEEPKGYQVRCPC